MRATGELKRQAASPIDPATIGPDKKNRQAEPLAMLVITGGDDLQAISETIERAMQAAKKESLVLRLDDDQSQTAEEQMIAMEKSITDLHAQGRIAPNTQVVITLHGSQEGADFGLGTLDGQVRVEAVSFVNFLLRHGNPKIHILSCGSGHLRTQLEQIEGTCFLHSGKKELSVEQGTELMQDFCRFLELQKEAPSDDQLFAFFETCAGANFAMTGHGQVVLHKTDNFEKYKGMPPGPDGVVAMEGLDEKKKTRVFFNKLEHGSNEKVIALLDKFGNGLFTSALRWPPAFLAAQSENQPNEKLETLYARGMDIDTLSIKGFSGLHYAALEETTVAAERLLAAGADPNLPSLDGDTALSLAIQEGNEAFAKLLLEKGAKTEHLSPAGISQLELAIELEQFGIALLLLEHGASGDVMTKSGESLLEWSIWNSQLPLMAALLKNRANPNAPAEAGGSLLQIAIDITDKEMLYLLLEYGANPAALTDEGGSLIRYAIDQDNLTAFCLLLGAKAGPAPVELSPDDWMRAFIMIKGHQDDSDFPEALLKTALENSIPANRLNSLCMAAMRLGALKLAEILISLRPNNAVLQQQNNQAQ